MEALDVERFRASFDGPGAALVSPKPLQHKLNHVALAMVRRRGVGKDK